MDKTVNTNLTSRHTAKYDLNDNSLGVSSFGHICCLRDMKIEGSIGSLQFILKLCRNFEDVNANCDLESVLNDDRRSGQHTKASSNSNVIHLV